MRASRSADFRRAGGRPGAPSLVPRHPVGRRRALIPWALLGTAVSLGLGLAVPLLLCAPAPAYGQGRAGNETEEESIFKRAEEQFNSGNYEGAAELYDQAIKLNPSRVESFVKRATLYFRERNYTQAIELLTRAEKLSSSDTSIKTVLGLCLYESGQKDRGLVYLEDVTRLRPEAYEAQFQIGKHYARTDPVRASTALEQYFRFRPEEQKVIDPSAQLFLGTAYFQRGKYPEAQKLLEQAQEARPRDNQIRQMLGTVYIALGQWSRGVAQYEPLLSDVKRRPAVAFNLATCYLHLGRREEARKLALQYQGLRHEDPRVLTLLAAIDQTGDKETDAREALKKYQDAQTALKDTADKPELQSRVNLPAAIARAYLQLRDAKHAIETAEAGLEALATKVSTAPAGSPQATLYTNYELELRGLLLEAQILQLNLNHTAPGASAVPTTLLSSSEKLLELAPAGDPQVLALAGSASYASANFERARKYYSEAQKIDPKLPRARIGLSRTLEQLALAGLTRGSEESGHERERDRERHEQERTAALGTAAGLLREAQRLDDSPSLTRNLAAVLLLQNSPSEADHILGPALAGAGRTDPTLWRLQSRTQLLLGRMPAAQEAAERAVAEAKKALDAVPATDPVRRAQLAMRLSEARLELGARYLAMDRTDGQRDAPRDAQRDSRDRERLDRAVETLTLAVKDLGQASGAENKELLRGGQRNLTLAHLRRGRLRLLEAETQISKGGVSAGSTKQAEDALADLQRAIELGNLESQGHERGSAECLAALAAVQAGQGKAARELLTRGKEDGCELVSPYNRLGTELIAAFINYRGGNAIAQREQLLKSLPKLQSKAGSGADSAALQKLLRAMQFSTNLALAYDYYLSGRSKLVGPTLRNAQKAQARLSEDDEAVLTHNLAVADVLEGHGGGEKVFERLGSRPPEALVNLGILYDRRGEIRKALDLYRKALERGARTGRLREWIDTKDRLLGQAQ